MAKSRRLLVSLTGLVLSLGLVVNTGLTVQAGSNKNYLDSLSGGVAAILDPSTAKSMEIINATARELDLTAVKTEEKST